MKNISVFYLKIINFLEVKFSIYLNRRVYVMGWQIIPFRVICFGCVFIHSNTVTVLLLF